MLGVEEKKRLVAARSGEKPWKKWGPYLSERQWGTVREDYSENGDAWNYFTHDQMLNVLDLQKVLKESSRPVMQIYLRPEMNE